jgi:hypothetical protein
MLAEAEERITASTRQATSAIITNLKLHFAYTGVPVTCRTVKPFLPSLAIPALEVNVPTPITVHLDQCQQCANDLEAIRQLDLTQDQLCRLSQVFADDPAEDAVNCSEAQAAMPAVVFMRLHEADAEVLKHLCTCPDCREQLYRFRERVCTELGDGEKTRDKYACEKVFAPDIFDYCFPYGIDPANNQYAKLGESLISHLRGCPTCLAQVQQLHKTICNIADKPDSEVVTCFTVEKQISEDVEPETSGLYADWPINVKVLGQSDVEARTSSGSISFPRLVKQRILALNPKRLIRPAAVAAAVVLVVLVSVNAPVAKSVDLNQIYRALENIKNVCLTTFIPEQSEPTQERWISKALTVMMVRTESQWVLWDIKGKSKKSKDLSTGSITITEPANNILAQVEKSTDVPWGLLPFDDISRVPPDAGWQQAADETIETTVPGTEVYDLVWTTKGLAGSVIIHRKWRGYIDAETRLPSRIEWWERPAEQDEYTLSTVIKVTYPTVDEIGSVIKEAGF